MLGRLLDLLHIGSVDVLPGPTSTVGWLRDPQRIEMLIGGVDATGVIGPFLTNGCRSVNQRDVRLPRLRKSRSASVGAKAAARSIRGDVKRLKRLLESDV